MALERREVIEDDRDFEGMLSELDVIPVDGPDANDLLRERLALWATVLEVVGGSIQVAAVRRKVGVDAFGEPVYVPDRYIIRFNSYMPAEEADQARTAAEADAALAAEVEAEEKPEEPVTVE